MRLNSADPAFATELRGLLPPTAFRDISPAYLQEPRGRWQGQAGVVVAVGRTTGRGRVRARSGLRLRAIMRISGRASAPEGRGCGMTASRTTDGDNE